MFLRKAGLTFALALAICGGAGAQQFTFGGPGILPARMVIGGNRLQFLQRPDVQNHLKVTVKQKDALAEMQKNPMKNGLRISVQSDRPGDEQDIRQQIESQVAAQQKSQDDEIKAILRPEQQKRLGELYLQWRGPIALGEPKTKDTLTLTQEQHDEIGKIVTKYQTQKMEILQELMQKEEEKSSEHGQIIRMKLNTKALNNPLNPSRKKLDALKKETEKQILDLLTEKDLTAWKKAQGEPFVFRKDLPGSWM